MNIWMYLYDLFIYPIELVFEILFSLIFKMTGNEALALILLSLAVNFLVLPLYNRADKIQEISRNKEKEIAPFIKHIRQNFKGDERFMLLQTCYRQHDYSPLNVLKSSVSLLLQIPFFMAAYNMLSDNRLLAGTSMGPIKDLSAPDGLIVIGALTINLLPILMTVINLISGLIYGKDMPLKSMIQLYALAAVFLVLLYNSPAGLVFYWTLNNVFSLCKNIVIRLMAKHKKDKASAPASKAKDATGLVFLASSVFLAVYVGFYLPSCVMMSSPKEFVNRATLINPATYLAVPFITDIGLFVIWGGMFYLLASPKARKIMASFMFAAACCSVFTGQLFSNEYGTMSSLLVYDQIINPKTTQILLNLGGIILITAVCFVLVKFLKPLAGTIAGVGAVVMIVMTCMNIAVITDTFKWKFDEDLNSSAKPEFTLSTEGQNVVVIMVDRAVGPMVPYIFAENPELVEKFDGFTYYENTMSFGPSTNFGAPALYGGYDYLPYDMNQQNDRLLVDKHNESLKVLPTIFTNEGYNCTFVNPTYAGYSWIPDLSVFDDMENVDAYNIGYNFVDGIEGYCAGAENIMLHNLCCFSFFKASPLFMQLAIYDNGNYNTLGLIDYDAAIQTTNGLSQAYGHNVDFEAQYYALKGMPEMTQILDDDSDNLLIFCTEITHNPTLLQEPDYVPQSIVDNTAYDTDWDSKFTIDGITMKMENITQVKHYDVNVAAYMLLGEWFDYLRENGLYDNTRIIIVADHGYFLGQFDYMLNDNIKAMTVKSDNNFDAESFAPVLMVKDFGATGFNVSSDFMTNADTPYLATEGIIDNPTNPFTGNPLIMSSDYKGTMFITGSGEFNVKEADTTFLAGPWYIAPGGLKNVAAWQFVFWG